MDQQTLNNANMADWELEDQYESVFHLNLTSKHQLAIGRWVYGRWSGVDLRRWSYDKAKLLGDGISLTEGIWQALCKEIIALLNEGLFASFSNKNRPKYETSIEIDEAFSLSTDVFSKRGMEHPYFCVNMTRNGKPIFKSKFAGVRAMIRFDTIPEFVANCRDHGLVPEESVKKVRKTDKKTGKKVF